MLIIDGAKERRSARNRVARLSIKIHRAVSFSRVARAFTRPAGQPPRGKGQERNKTSKVKTTESGDKGGIRNVSSGHTGRELNFRRAPVRLPGFFSVAAQGSQWPRRNGEEREAGSHRRASGCARRRFVTATGPHRTATRVVSTRLAPSRTTSRSTASLLVVSVARAMRDASHHPRYSLPICRTCVPSATRARVPTATPGRDLGRLLRLSCSNFYIHL